MKSLQKHRMSELLKSAQRIMEREQQRKVNNAIKKLSSSMSL